MDVPIVSTSNSPSVSIVIPTYNSERVLKECLESIRNQDYVKDKIEIIVADGGSTDKTLEITRQYTNMIIHNPLKTGEAGKALGVKNSSKEIIAFIDSDNVLPTTDWLARMIGPFRDLHIAGTEPLCYTYRKTDGLITRYCALLGMNDPLCYFLGNYDRYSHLSARWTEMNVRELDKDSYLEIELNERDLPTLGANGFLIRRTALGNYPLGDYLFDLDMVHEVVRKGDRRFAKVKIGIVHVFSTSISTFVRKQKRRINDFSFYKNKGLRTYSWSSVNKVGLVKFVLFTTLTIPLVIQALRGYVRKPDRAWLFHIIACWITLMVYSFVVFRGRMHRPKTEDRTVWSQ